MDNLEEIEIKIINEELFNKLNLKLECSTPGSAGIDVAACISEPVTIKAKETHLIPLGFAMHIKNPKWASILMPRSGLGAKKGIVLGNLVGLIDSDYQGEVSAMLWNRNEEGEYIINPGERIAQIIFVPVTIPKLKMVTSFNEDTIRGSGGYGSTGTN